MTHVRTLLSHSSKIFIALLATALIFSLTTNGAQANHQPADKVAASGGIDEVTFVPEGETKLLLDETFRTSTTSDLLLHVSSECSIITDVATLGDDSQVARAQLRFFMTISTDGGAERPIGVTQMSTSTTSSEDGDDGNVVFCDRRYERQTSGFGTDDQNHKIDTFFETRSANAFNWVELNAGRGIHTVRLYATYQEQETDTANAEGIVGRRTLIIEPVKMKNDEHVSDVVVD